MGDQRRRWQCHQWQLPLLQKNGHTTATMAPIRSLRTAIQSATADRFVTLAEARKISVAALADGKVDPQEARQLRALLDASNFTISRQGRASISDLLPPAGVERTRNVELVVVRDGVNSTQLFVPALIGRKKGLLHLDTGAAQSFVYGAARDITIGGQKTSLAGRSDVQVMPPVSGLPVLGVFGVDQLLRGASVLDTRAGNLTLFPPGTKLQGAESWPAIPFDKVQGHLIAKVTVGGKARRLMVDTGAQHTLLVPQAPAAGDLPVETTDAVGNKLHFWLGQGTLGVGAQGRNIPVLKATSFPYFEETVRMLGGNIHGLLGLSALGNGRVIFDAGHLKIEQ